MNKTREMKTQRLFFVPSPVLVCKNDVKSKDVTCDVLKQVDGLINGV
jgi:hypothetical protein